MKLCGFDVGLDKPFFLIAGPCVVESEQLQMDVAGRLKEFLLGFTQASANSDDETYMDLLLGSNTVMEEFL